MGSSQSATHFEVEQPEHRNNRGAAAAKRVPVVVPPPRKPEQPAKPKGYDEHVSYGMSRTCPRCGDPGLESAATQAPGGPMGPCVVCGHPPLSYCPAEALAHGWDDAGGALEAWTDGSGTVAEQHAGIGVVVARRGIVLCEASEPIGFGTNNIAEVRAVGRALALAFGVARSRGVPLVVRSDSAFALGAVAPGSTWNVRRPELATLCAGVRAECAKWPALRLEHVAGHSGVVMNERAHQLAGAARKRGIARAGAGAR